MNKFHQIICSISLILLFSGCANKSITLPSLDTDELPSFSLPEFTFFDDLEIDKRLPLINGVKVYTDMDEAAIEWRPIYTSNIKGYRIFRKENKESRFKLIKIIEDRYQAHFCDTRLKPNTTYTYAISSYTQDDRVSSLSKEATIKTKPALEELRYFEAISGFPNRIKLIWRPHQNKAVMGYVIKRWSKVLKRWKEIAEVENRLNIEYIDTDIEPMKDYIYRIQAKTFKGDLSNPRDSQKARAKNLPATIRGLQATNNLSRKIELIWKPINNPDLLYYNVYKSSLPNSLFRQVGQTKANYFVDLLDEDNKVVYYKVTAVDKYGLESFMPRKAAKGMSAKAIVPPKPNKAIIQNKSVTLTWVNQDRRAVKNKIIKKYRDGFTLEEKILYPTKLNTFVDTDVEEGKVYSYVIIAVDSSGVESPPSKEIRAAIVNIQ